MIDIVSDQLIKFASSFQAALEHMVMETVLTPDIVSIHFTFYNPGLTGYMLSLLCLSHYVSIDVLVSCGRMVHLPRTLGKMLLPFLICIQQRKQRMYSTQDHIVLLKNVGTFPVQ